MGLVFQATGDYAIGLMLLSDVALASLVFTAWRLGGTGRPTGQAARGHDPLTLATTVAS
jgi:MFS transporter, NNP family, nitrate/nitrite transporter